MLRQLYSKISSCRKCFDDVEIRSKISSLDKFMFLPPRLENGVPKYVFITMEPTDSWCNSREHGEKLLSDGMVNFYYSKNMRNCRGPIILQFVAQSLLCDDGDTYLITDLGKCSMPPEGICKITSETRTRRFDNCANFLIDELEGVKPKHIFIVGKSVEDYVKKQCWYKEYEFICSVITHYSGVSQRSGFFNNYCRVNDYKFNEFKINYSDMESRVRIFIEKRKSEIKNDGRVKFGSDVCKNLRKSLNYNLHKGITEPDMKMIFYYWSELIKYKSK